MAEAGATGVARYSIRAICSTYPPVLGGTEIEMQRVCSVLRARGHGIRVLTAGGGPMPRTKVWVDPRGVSVRIFGSWCPARWRQYVYALGVAYTLFRERHDYQIAYFLMSGIQLAIALPVARLLRKHIVMKFSGSENIASLASSRLGRFELRMLRSWADCILVLNSAMVEEAVSAGLDRAQLGWMPNPVDVDEFRPATHDERVSLRRARGLPAESPLVLFAGRLAPEKELPSLIEAFAGVVRNVRDARLVLIGDGPLRLKLEAAVQTLSISDNVYFTGALAPAEMSGWLQAADIFALVSSREGLPCALLEAMSSGLPAVVSDIAGNRQLIQESVNGCLVPCGDSKAIALACLRLIGDPLLRSTLGAAGRELVVREYSTAKVVNDYERMFGRIVQSASTRRPRPQSSQLA